MKPLLTFFSAAFLAGAFSATKVEADSLLTMLPLASFKATTSVKGLTWEKTSSNLLGGAGDGISGVVHVGCGSGQGGVGHGDNNCNPYQGDTDCATPLPLLCFYAANLNKPASLTTIAFYHDWSGGIVATTEPVPGSSFATITAADAFCAEKFGPGWKVAEHHDSGGGWAFFAYGNIGENYLADQRFWVDVTDQLNGTCWSR
uniref:hypothetical protein n=1 Tax=Candidatus Electronema sp. TaxID=2698783 RepID=UPI004056D871